MVEKLFKNVGKCAKICIFCAVCIYFAFLRLKNEKFDKKILEYFLEVVGPYKLESEKIKYVCLS